MRSNISDCGNSRRFRDEAVKQIHKMQVTLDGLAYSSRHMSNPERQSICHAASEIHDLLFMLVKEKYAMTGG